MGEKNLTRVLIALAHEFNSPFLNDLKCPVRFGFYKKKKKKKDFRRKKGYLYWDLQGLKKKEKKRKLIVTVVLFCIQRKLALALTHAPCIWNQSERYQFYWKLVSTLLFSFIMINFRRIKKTSYEIHLISEGGSEMAAIFFSFTNTSAVFDKT